MTDPAPATSARSGRPPVVMGVVNVTIDSFSDGGRFLDVERAVARGIELIDDGADIVDVGGESTRPGADRVDPAVETARVVPVVRALAERGVAVSVDTMRASVAAAAVEAGASWINDVSAGLADPAMSRTVADAGVGWMLMHWSATPDWTHRPGSPSAQEYGDIVDDVRTGLLRQVDAAVDAGVSADRIVLDPGLGFAKNADHNWALLRGLGRLVDTGLPVLVGASRKRFLGTLLARDGVPRPPGERDVATAAISVLAASAGAWGVRVHVVRSTVDALAVHHRWTASDDDGGHP